MHFTYNQIISPSKKIKKSLIDNQYYRKYKNWNGSYKNLEDILKFNNEHWQITKVISINPNLIELSIINSNEIIILDNENNLYGPKKVPEQLFKYK